MAKYTLGNALNALRDSYEAPTDKAAWEKGRRMFNKALPSQGGRGVFLSRKVELPCTPSPHQEGWATAYNAIMCGNTFDPWPADWPDNL